MPTIKGFTTKKDVLEQVKAARSSVKLPFTVKTFAVSKNPLEGLSVKDGKNNALRIDKKQSR